MKPFILWKKIENRKIYGIMSNFSKKEIGWIDSYGNERYYPEYDNYEDISDDYSEEEEPNPRHLPNDKQNISKSDWNRSQQRKYYKNLRENLNNSSNPEYSRPQHLPNDIQFAPIHQHNHNLAQFANDKITYFQNNLKNNSRKVVAGAGDLLIKVQQQQQKLRNARTYGNAGYGMNYDDGRSYLNDNSFDISYQNFLSPNEISSKTITNVVTVKYNQGVWDIAKEILGKNASNEEINSLKNNIIRWNKLNQNGDIEVGQRLFIVDPQNTIGQIRNGRNYYDAQGRLLYNTNINEGVQFFVEDNGKWIQGLSYQSIFGDENKPAPLKYIHKVEIPNFINEIPYYAQNSQFLQFGNPTLTRLQFWINSGPEGTYDYKYSGDLKNLKKTDDEKNNYDGVVLISNNLLINPHEAGMFIWGYAASRAYGGEKWNSYFRLAEDNKKMHLNVEGNTDEWGEVFAWTFGYMLHRHNNKISESLYNDVSEAMKYYYKDDPSYKLRKYKYKAWTDKPNQTIWRKIVEATIITF